MPHVPDDFYEIVDVELPPQQKRGRDLKAIPEKRPSGTAVKPSPKPSLLPKLSMTDKLSLSQHTFGG
jgi:hypothetical protein